MDCTIMRSTLVTRFHKNSSVDSKQIKDNWHNDIIDFPCGNN